jgi:hypothetical protein
MSNDEWTTSDDAAFEAATRDETHPSTIALAFMSVMEDPTGWTEELRSIVTPESVDSWGDFSAAAAVVASINDWGLGSVPNAAYEAPDVAYVKILRGVTESYQQEGDDLILVPAVLTLVWRPEFGRWLVHGIGNAVRPEDVPRTSPGEAPAY